MRKAAFALALLLVTTGYTPARAAGIDVTYALSGAIFLPNLATQLGVANGTFTVRYTATGGVVSTPGIGIPPSHNALAHVLGGSIAGILSFTVFGDLFTGSFAGAVVNFGNGTLSSLGALNIGLGVNVSGIIHCTGATCSGLGVPPSIPLPFGLLGGGPIAPIVTTGLGQLVPTWGTAGLLIGTFNSLPVTAQLTAQEITRHYIPEPSTLPLVGMGLLGLAAIRQQRRARRG